MPKSLKTQIGAHLQNAFRSIAIASGVIIKFFVGLFVTMYGWLCIGLRMELGRQEGREARRDEGV